MMLMSLDTLSATRAKQSIVRLVRVRAAAAKGPTPNDTSTAANGVADLVKEHASHRVALFYKSGWKAPVAHVHAATTPE